MLVQLTAIPPDFPRETCAQPSMHDFSVGRGELAGDRPPLAAAYLLHEHKIGHIKCNMPSPPFP